MPAKKEGALKEARTHMGGMFFASLYAPEGLKKGGVVENLLKTIVKHSFFYTNAKKNMIFVCCY